MICIETLDHTCTNKGIKSYMTLQGNSGRIDKTYPNQDVINDRKLTYFNHSGQCTVNTDIFCQIFVTLDNFLSIFCHLSRLDSDIILSIRPCSVKYQKRH